MTLKMTLHEMSLKEQAVPEELSPERMEELDAMAAREAVMRRLSALAASKALQVRAALFEVL